jgi:hypothetical protein
MLNKNLAEQDALRSALGPGPECPTIEELASCASEEAPVDISLSRHLQACAYCQTELHLMRTFLAGEKGDASEAVRLLRGRSKEIFRKAFPTQAKVPWWQAVFTVRRLAQASMAFAAILLVVGTVLFVRSSTHSPDLVAKSQQSQEVYRSGSFAVVTPAGDLQQPPKEIRWEHVPSAASYQARILEVDQSEVWNARTTEDRIELPAAIRARIVPSKTLFIEITAFESSGKQVGDTGRVRFRLVQK